MTPKSKAVLLANHGVLSWAPDPAAAVMLGVVVEEAAQAAIYASAIGGPRVVPHELLHASLQRHQHFSANANVLGFKIDVRDTLHMLY